MEKGFIFLISQLLPTQHEKQVPVPFTPVQPSRTAQSQVSGQREVGHQGEITYTSRLALNLLQSSTRSKDPGTQFKQGKIRQILEKPKNSRRKEKKSKVSCSGGKAFILADCKSNLFKNCLQTTF